jgi:hypothetical protein
LCLKSYQKLHVFVHTYNTYCIDHTATGIPDRVERRTGIKPFTVVPLGVDWLTNGLPDIGMYYIYCCTIHTALCYTLVAVILALLQHAHEVKTLFSVSTASCSC